MTEARFVTFLYREFFDVPREVLFQFAGRWYLLQSRFGPEKDAYDPGYSVFRLPEAFVVPEESWVGMPGIGAVLLGSVAVADVRFDATRRSQLEVPDLICR